MERGCPKALGGWCGGEGEVGASACTQCPWTPSDASRARKGAWGERRSSWRLVLTDPIVTAAVTQAAWGRGVVVVVWWAGRGGEGGASCLPRA